jgi:hypothetical protein
MASGAWCAILFCCLLCLAMTLWAHRFGLSAPTPGGVVVLLQRPG